MFYFLYISYFTCVLCIATRLLLFSLNKCLKTENLANWRKKRLEEDRGLRDGCDDESLLGAKHEHAAPSYHMLRAHELCLILNRQTEYFLSFFQLLMWSIHICFYNVLKVQPKLLFYYSLLIRVYINFLRAYNEWIY